MGTDGHWSLSHLDHKEPNAMIPDRNRTRRVGARILLVAATSWALSAATALSAPTHDPTKVVAADAGVSGTTIHYLRAGAGKDVEALAPPTIRQPLSYRRAHNVLCSSF